MNYFITEIKLCITAVFGALAAWLGIVPHILIILAVVMIIDYITGIINAWISGELCSKCGIVGIFKKTFYLIIIAVASIADKLIVIIAQGFNFDIKLAGFFGMLTAIWLILNELLSILENIGKLNVPMPDFLKKAIYVLKNSVEEKGKIEEDNNE